MEPTRKKGTMNQKVLIGIASLLAAFASYGIMRGGPSQAPATKPMAGTETGAASVDVQPASFSAPAAQSNRGEPDFSSVLSHQDKARLAEGYVLTVEDKERLLRRMRQTESVPTMDELEVLMDTPVEFFGQVLDQFDQPVVGADISCSWSFMAPHESPLKLQSLAPNGEFEIPGLKAISIHVFVSPPKGYDEQVDDSRRIRIAKAPDRILNSEGYKRMTPEQREQLVDLQGRAEAYKGDRKSPVIFRLKRL
jgi:hypothetical protein